MDIEIFWRRVKALLKQKRVIQNEAALACGFPPDTFKGWMAKRIIPTVFDAYLIAGYLGVNIDYLIHGKETGKSKIIGEILLLLNKAVEKLKEANTPEIRYIAKG